ncbi:hypothetical protein KP003_16750 [Geomonas nitrogeniifigens]|uniref:hypothetical protein n=1 Tax=Geomonas diazotrophica TaxID=2843197 RepID=UPI001C2BB224|nr:hypothetical protein [Geomonas nitrogeniifigens]QXE85991.1 hypothetical protein KP003_16750 [Geomonas nitrogeniifigens]
MKYHECTEKEKAAMEAVKAAVKALPRGIKVGVEQFDGTLEFWKMTPKGIGYAAMIGSMKTSKTEY